LYIFRKLWFREQYKYGDVSHSLQNLFLTAHPLVSSLKILNGLNEVLYFAWRMGENIIYCPFQPNVTCAPTSHGTEIELCDFLQKGWPNRKQYVAYNIGLIKM
jgi:hypothetical protein